MIDDKLLKKIILREIKNILKEENIADYAEDPESEMIVVKEMQNLINEVSRGTGKFVKVDGMLGPNTILALKKLASSGLNELSKYIPSIEKRMNFPTVLYKTIEVLEAAKNRGAGEYFR